MKKNRFLMVLVVAVMVLAMVPATAMAGDTMNFKIYLIDQNNHALTNYIITVDNNSQAVSNSEGIASFNGLALQDADTFKLFTSDGKKQLGAFNMRYNVYEHTSIDYDGSNYILNYSTPDASVYMYWIYNPNAAIPFHPADASDDPLQPGSPMPKKDEPKPQPSPAKVTNPQLVGYLVDEDGKAVKNAAIKSTNDKSGGSVTATSDSKGFFVLPGISAGKHTMSFKTEDSKYNDTFQFNVKVSDASRIVKQSDELLELDIKSYSDVVYANFLVGTDGNVDILAVSNKVLPSPVKK